MNCDTAFDLMTDVETARSSALARHLEMCPRCRQMQDTLAPALDFLSRDSHDEQSREFPAMIAEFRGGDRLPVVTIEALKIAEQAAAGLVAKGETRRVRVQRLTARGLRYAAVFAAGVFLAATLFAHRDHPLPIEGPVDGRCTRSDADRNEIGRSTLEIRRLALSCAVCHDAVSHPATSRQSRLTDEFDWLRPLLAGETLLALCERAISMRRA
jgi:hypothetical protein